MRPAVRRLAAPIATTLVALALVAATGSPAAARTSGTPDPRGAYRVADTPNPPAAPGEPVVALTFDDGPSPSATPQILEVLRRANVKATFFMLGSQAEQHPDLVRQVLADGHAVANHTYAHPRLTRLDDAGFAAEVDRTQDVLQRITGVRPTCLRPPYGASDPAVVARATARGLVNVLWSADSRDFTKPGVDAIVAGALDGLSAGSVILLHDGGGVRDQTIAALPRIIEEVRRRGFRFAPICHPDPHLPTGGLDEASGGKGSFRLRGWVADPDADDPLAVQVLVDQAVVEEATAELDRPDLAARGRGTRHGFDLEVPVPAGRHDVCLRATNVGPGSTDPTIGCVELEVADPLPYDLGREVTRVRFVRTAHGPCPLDPPLRVRQAFAARAVARLLR